jgi:hypothetical protein
MAPREFHIFSCRRHMKIFRFVAMLLLANFYFRKHLPLYCLHIFWRDVPWLRRLAAGLSPRRPWLVAGSVHLGFVVDNVALGQVFRRVLRYFPVSIIPPRLYTHLYQLEHEQ